MAIPMLHATTQALGDRAEKCESLSLFAARFADPQATDKATPTRKDWFQRLLSKKAEAPGAASWHPDGTEFVHARLMSRLMVDLAGGVMENANLNLDRYGLPRIPGSAVKGCARRMALQALHDWNAALASFGQTEFESTDLCAPCCEGFESPAEMLAAIARVFGWVETDWTAQKNRDPKTQQETTWKSDFAWACGGGFQPPSPPPALESVTATLRAARELLPPPKSFAGTIAFLPASPNRDPGLELDVVTPHHTKYYSGEKGYEHAPDTEDPIPVFFPAVKPQKEGGYFTFPLIPLRLARDGDVTLAKRWLSHGLELFGLGAKTNAGYGWFDASPELNARIESEARARRRVAKLANDHAAFAEWSSDLKDGAILDLSDRPQDCADWQRIDPISFQSLAEYAAAQNLPLL